MSRSARLFEIIQLLRNSKRPILARDIAAALEISIRTVYRDIASLQAMQTPIYGEAGVGYVMRKGYDLPPVQLDVEEAEAIAAQANDADIEQTRRRLIEACQQMSKMIGAGAADDEASATG